MIALAMGFLLTGICDVTVWAQNTQGPEPSGVEALQERVKALEQTVEDLKKERGPAPGEVGKLPPAEEQQRPTAGTSTAVPDHNRERGFLRQDSYAEPRLDNAPFDPKLRGFFRIPGTESMLRIGGFARIDVIHDFEPAGNTSKFLPSSIPTGPNPGNDNTSISVAASRLSIELRNNTRYGPLRIYYENDFNNGPNTTNAFRLRHFYGQWTNVLVGQTWSLWKDVDATPDTVDFAGPNSAIFMFQPQIRYTYGINEKNIVAMSVEQPSSAIPGTITAPIGTVTTTATSPIPDFVARYRYQQDGFHIQTAWLFRSVGGFVGATGEQQVFGWGGMLSAGARVYGKDNIVFQVAGGEGIARYILGLGPGSGVDAGLTSAGRLVALPAYGAFVAYQHFWAERWRSTGTYGFLQANTTDLAQSSSNPAPLFKQTQYAEGNVMYSPGHGFTIGAALLWGQYIEKDGALGNAFRLNFVLQYDLVNLGNW